MPTSAVARAAAARARGRPGPPGARGPGWAAAAGPGPRREEEGGGPGPGRFAEVAARPGGLLWLVRHRERLLESTRGLPRTMRQAHVEELEGKLRRFLAERFSPAHLALHRVTEVDSDGALLASVVRYEAVHAMAGVEDLRPRLGAAFRCLALVHPELPAAEPVALLHTRVSREGGWLGGGSIAHVLAASDAGAEPVEAKGAVRSALFYSLSLAQRGLTGIDMGKVMMAKAKAALKAEFPALESFATLSPIPGFRRWLHAKLAEAPGEAALLSPGEAELVGGTGGLREVLDGGSGGWGRAREVLLRLCARYIALEKKEGGTRALDPVTHFHVGNGARAWHLNWGADTSAAGERNSCG